MIILVGIIGALLILLAFILNQIHIWKDRDLIYDLTNFLGAVLLAIYGVIINGWPFVILNSVWAIVSLRDVVLDIKKK
jgi:O-antigen ligase